MLGCALAVGQKKASPADIQTVKNTDRSGVWVKMTPVQTKLIVAMIFIVMNATKIL